MLKRFLSVVTVIVLIAVIVPISYINQQKCYNDNSFISVSSDAGIRSYKFFDALTLKQRTPVRHAYIGGFPIGISLKTDGVLVEQIEEINTTMGKASLKNYLKKGDVILSINGEETLYAEDISRILNNLDNEVKKINLRVFRGKEYIDVEISPIIEEFTSKLRLGLKVKDTIAGVGTITFIKADGSFGALGHPICNFATGECISCKSGQIYDCKVMGISRGDRGKPGELKASLKNVQSPIGSISTNNKYGIYGKIDTQKIDSTLYEIGERTAVTPGKAQILTTVSDQTQLYDIEIIKANYQNSINDKSMVIRVTDKRLLDSTGGVVQGMSGSPIIQNDKLVGAVTHVFVNDPCKGYGIYLDWMFSQ